ncbi:MAG: hypothetical protein LH650_02565, partial [Chloroflexi bacterium]|nr:hypothetical protein [Chloroflexota bacterium]
DGVLSLPIGDIDRVREIRVQVGEWLADAHGIDPPISARYARWHLATATALAAAGLTKQRFPWPLPTAVADLVARVTVTARPSAVGDLRSEGYAVVAGTRVFWSMEVPRGHAGDPFTDDGLTSRAVEMGAFDRTSSAARAFASVTGSSGTVRAVLAAAG